MPEHSELCSGISAVWVCRIIVPVVNPGWFLGLVVFVWVEGVLGEDFSGVAVDEDAYATTNNS